MSEYNFITSEDVKRACIQLGLSDWSTKSNGAVDEKEAGIIQKKVGGEALDVSNEAFRIGLEVELEHGTLYPDTNVTANHPVATGLIVLAHLKESLDYYSRLQCMELEMELDKALVNGDAGRALAKRRDLAAARTKLEDNIGAGYKTVG